MAWQAQVADLQADCRGLQHEIDERGHIIQDNFQAMRQQKERVLDLEKHVFVLEARKQVLTHGSTCSCEKPCRLV